jgi:hypothetical protein
MSAGGASGATGPASTLSGASLKLLPASCWSNFSIANGGTLFSEPTSKLPEPAKAEEPAPVQLPQDGNAG